MGRPPIGTAAMTNAERQRKRRQRLEAEKYKDWTPDYRIPAKSIEDAHHNAFVDRLGRWLDYGDIDQVTKWLADNLDGRWEELGPRFEARRAELERQAIADDAARTTWLKEHPEEAAEDLRRPTHDADLARDVDPVTILPDEGRPLAVQIRALLRDFTGRADDPLLPSLSELLQRARKTVYAKVGPKPRQKSRIPAWKRKQAKQWKVGAAKIGQGSGVVMSAERADRIIALAGVRDRIIALAAARVP